MEVSGLDHLKAALHGLTGEKCKPDNREACFRGNRGIIPRVWKAGCGKRA